MPTQKATTAPASTKTTSTKSRAQAKGGKTTSAALKTATGDKHSTKPTAQAASPLDGLRKAFAALSTEEQKLLLQEWTSQITQDALNPLTKLVELVQKEYGANLTTEVWTEGASHIPVVYCKITLPNGTEYTANGKNQKAAKQLAAQEALADLQNT